MSSDRGVRRGFSGMQNPLLRTMHLDDNPPNGNVVDYAGYGSLDELVKGYRSSSDEAKRLKARADQAEQRIQLLEQQMRPQIPQRNDPVSRLQEYGVPTDALDEYVNQRISAGVAAAFEPVIKAGTARNSLLSSYPDYQKFEADVATFVNEDPQLSSSYQKLFSTDPVAAMEYAFLKFGETKRKAGGEPQPKPQSRARSEAQIPSSRTGDARTQPNQQQDETIQRSWDHFQKTGDPRAFAKARLRQVISEDFLTRG